MHDEKESLSGWRLSKDHSWRNTSKDLWMYVSHVYLSSCKLTSQGSWILFFFACLVDPNKRRKCASTYLHVYRFTTLKNKTNSSTPKWSWVHDYIQILNKTKETKKNPEKHITKINTLCRYNLLILPGWLNCFWCLEKNQRVGVMMLVSLIFLISVLCNDLYSVYFFINIKYIYSKM